MDCAGTRFKLLLTTQRYVHLGDETLKRRRLLPTPCFRYLLLLLLNSSLLFTESRKCLSLINDSLLESYPLFCRVVIIPFLYFLGQIIINRPNSSMSSLDLLDILDIDVFQCVGGE